MKNKYKPQKPTVPFTKAVRFLPSYVEHLANGIDDLPTLRSRVKGERVNYAKLLIEKHKETNSGVFFTPEMEEIDRKITQLSNFLENTA
jgi:hypothetical protein